MMDLNTGAMIEQPWLCVGLAGIINRIVAIIPYPITTLSIYFTSLLFIILISSCQSSAANHIRGRWIWKLTTGDVEDWYRCVNCGDLMLDQRPTNIHVALNCNTCGNGHEALVKVDPVEEAKARNEAIDRVTFR